MRESFVIFVEPLTSREEDVLQELAKGGSNADIGLTLFITEKTVRHHLHEIMGKLGVASRLEAVLTAQEMGLVSMPNQLSPAALAVLALLRAHPSVLAELREAGLLV